VRGRQLQVLGGIVALAAVVRFATLDEQSFWYDEAVAIGLVRMDLGDMLDRIPESESTPPLYYVVAWLWAKLFGTGEVGLRALSALCGTAFVPVAYAAAARLASARAGLVAAGLAAVNPLLVWYSQEARAYALLVLLAGLSFYLFARLLTGDLRRRTVVLWVVVSAVALTTHYFAAFLVAVEAAWLLTAAADRRPIAIATAALAAVQAALLPLLLHQRSLDLADFIDEIPLGYRLARTPKQFLVGFDAPGEVASAFVAGLLVAVALWLVWSRGDDRERRAARVGLVVGGTLLAAPALLALVGVDHFDTRNVLVAWPPLAVAVAAGLGARRSGWAGPAAAVALALVSSTTVLFVATRPTLQRDNWRGVAEALGEPLARPRAVVITPFTAPAPFAVYVPRLELMPDAGATAREIDLVAMPLRRRTQSRPGPPPRPGDHPPPAPGFELVETRFEETYTILRYTSPTLANVTPAELAAQHVEFERRAAVFVEP
jgi:mannosyltransferase